MICKDVEPKLTDYLDRALPAMESRAIATHLRECAHCRAEADAARRIDQRLRIECGLFVESLTVGSRTADAQQRILAALRQSAIASNPPEMSERLWRVRRVLAMLCGPNAGRRMIECAQDSREPHWPAFLQRLSFLTTEICGRHAGELILAVGND